MGTRVNIYFIDEKVLKKIDKKVEEGVYRSRSHAVEKILKDHLGVEEFSGPI